MKNLIPKYLSKMNLVGTEVFTREESNQLMNEYVISYYKGRVSLTEEKAYTATEIAEKLSFIDVEFERKFNELWEEEFDE